MHAHQRRNWGIVGAAAAAVMIIWGVWLATTSARAVSPLGDAAYHAVLLDNGDVYYGRLEQLESRFPTLTDVYYAQRIRGVGQQNTEFRLVKRGKEWHQPDRLVLNPDHIVFVEPVGADSQVAKFIAELRDTNLTTGRTP
jgi:hypothetical protein